MTKHSYKWIIPLIVSVVFLLVTSAFAQKTSGTITGTVVDVQGAVVPNAQVTIGDPTTGLTRTVTTDSRGFFSAPELPAATYTVTVAQTGFKQYKASGVQLHVASVVTLSVQLQLGEKTEIVNVEATDIQVQTDSAQLGEVVNGQQVRELPLNGRSFVQLTQLQPGVSAANNFDSKNKGLLAGVDFAVNGNANISNLFLVDGANNNDVGSNRTILIYPSIDAIAEFKMLRNSYGAEYGQASGAVINIATRSGSNQWHGGVSYFGRNDVLNSYEYFAAQGAAAAKAQGGTATPKDKLRRNDYGYYIGGPIIKDKLFFFFNQEWNKEIRGATRTACVPDAYERVGDFSHPVGEDQDHHPLMNCNAPQPNFDDPNEIEAGIPLSLHVLDPNKLDNAGSLLVSQLPMPTLSTPLPDTTNWIQSLPSKINWRQENVRVDYNLNNANTIMGRYTQDHWENPAPTYLPGGLWGDDPWPSLESNWNQPSRQAVAKLTTTIGGTFVNDVSFTYSMNKIIITPGGSDPTLLQAITDAIPTSYPESMKTGHERIPTIWGGFGGYGSGQNLWMIAPWQNDLGIYTIRDDASKVVGNHVFKAGVFLGWDGKNQFNSTASSEGATFGTADWDTSRATGNQLANILYPTALQTWVDPANRGWGMNETSTNVKMKLRWHDYEFYVADTWKVRSNLTADLGLRYSWLPYPHSPNGMMTSFQPNLYKEADGANGCNGLWIVPGTDYCTQYNEQFGSNFVKGTPGPNETLLYMSKKMFAPRLGLAWDPWGTGNNSVRAGFGMFYQREFVNPDFVLQGNAPFSMTAWIKRPLGDGIAAPAGNASPAGGRDPSAVVPVSYQWNLILEHGFAKNTTLSVGYVGNRAAHQTSSWDVNMIPEEHWLAAAFMNNDNGQKQFRPYGPNSWASLTYFAHTGDATYHSLQTLFKTRYKRSELQAAYTWSHSISNVLLDNSSGGLGNQSYTNFNDPSLDRGNSPINRPHIFVANAVVNLPELKDRNGMLRNVLGGWELGVIQSISAGNSFTIYQNGIGEDKFKTVDGHAGSLSSLFGSGYTNMQRPLIVAGQKCKGDGAQIVNPASLTLVGYEIGTLPASTEPRGYCGGPNYVNTDLSINKNWQVPFIQNEKMRIQFRFDMFNVFNHANFRADQLGNGQVAYNVNCGPANAEGLYQHCSTANNVITTTSTNNGWGRSNRTTGPRELQYGLKLVF